MSLRHLTKQRFCRLHQTAALSRFNSLSTSPSFYSNEDKKQSFQIRFNSNESTGKTTENKETLTAVPTLDIAKSMQTSFETMDNKTLVILANMNENTAARAEILKRHIMSVDEVDYQTACETFGKIEKRNKELSAFLGLPYQLGMFAGLTAGYASFLLVFDINTVKWFNEHFVTTDVPEPQDLETILEVGSWSWNWMEPPLGQISFFLLCLQHVRSQVSNLGAVPYEVRVKVNRASKLSAEFSSYDKDVLTSYSVSTGYIG